MMKTEPIKAETPPSPMYMAIEALLKEEVAQCPEPLGTEAAENSHNVIMKVMKHECKMIIIRRTTKYSVSFVAILLISCLCVLLWPKTITLGFDQSGIPVSIRDSRLSHAFVSIIPEGYYIDHCLSAEGDTIISYTDGKSHFLNINIYDGGNDMTLNDSYESVSQISIYQSVATVLLQPHNEITIIWYENDAFYVICGNIDYETLCETARHVCKA